MDIYEIAETINNLSSGYNIGELQGIRKELKKLSRRPGTKIFSDSTISEDGWAFHHGGRAEIQFNIGFEDEGLRYGLAFSLEASQTLPDVSILYPKIFKLNCLIRENPESFSEYKWWYWNRGRRSNILNMSEIPDSVIEPHTFIFFGKIGKAQPIDFNNVLTTFDSLLQIYTSIEGNREFHQIALEENNNEFIFNNSAYDLVNRRRFTSVERETNINVRHSLIQQELFEILKGKYGYENVSVENSFNGNRIDVVLKTETGYVFYEVKTASSAKACIRQGIGQLLEYGFFPSNRNAEKIIIVGENPIDTQSEQYISFLNTEMSIPVEYMQVSISSN
jgi:hypothetical protein